MNNKAFIENLDNFLTGKMSASEAEAFRSAAQQDPLLNSELQLQEDILSSIKEHRKAELKANLSKVPVSTGLTSLQKIGIVASGVAASTIALFAIFADTEKETIVPQEQPSVVAETIMEQPAPSEATPIGASNLAINEVLSEEQETPYAQMGELTAEPDNELVSENQPLVNNEAEQVPEEATPEEVLADGTGFGGGPELEEEGELSLGSNEDSPNGLGESTNENVTLEGKQPNWKYNKKEFHYHYTGEDLTLFGKFDKSNPYSLIDLNYNNQLYFHYEGVFYRIEVTKAKMPLAEQQVTDPIIIEKLEQYIKTNQR